FKTAHQEGWKVLESSSISHGKASPFLPVIDLLRGYFNLSGEDDMRARRSRVTDAIIALDRSLESTLPYLLALLGVSEEGAATAEIDSQTRMNRTLDAVKRLILRESLNQPLIIIFEDLHWIDAETQ